MATPWCRLWADMPNDPKWRVIAKASNQSISNVVAVYVHLLACATNANANERGRTLSFVCEDIAAALDILEHDIEAIKTAMQGRVLDGDRLLGWEKRQPIKEDGAAERSKAWREAKKQDEERNRTKANAKERPDTDADADTDADSNKKKSKALATATRLPIDWQPSETDYLFAKQERPEINPRSTADQFRDYWIAKSGKDATKADWPATWRNWVRRQTATKQSYESAADKSRKTIEGLTGRASNEQRNFIDIN